MSGKVALFLLVPAIGAELLFGCKPKQTGFPTETKFLENPYEESVKLGEVPPVPKLLTKPLTKMEIGEIKNLIAELSKIDRPDVGLSPTMSGNSFPPLAGTIESGAMMLLDHGLKQ